MPFDSAFKQQTLFDLAEYVDVGLDFYEGSPTTTEPRLDQFEQDVDNAIEGFGIDIDALISTDFIGPVPLSFDGPPSLAAATYFDSLYDESHFSNDWCYIPSPCSTTTSTSEEINDLFEVTTPSVWGSIAENITPPLSPSSASDHSSPESPILSSPSIGSAEVEEYTPAPEIQIPEYNAQIRLSPAITYIELPPESTELDYSGGKQDIKHICRYCAREFKRKYNLTTHLDIHNPSRVRKYICEVESCEKAFSRKHDMRRHMMALHPNPDSAPTE